MIRVCLQAEVPCYLFFSVLSPSSQSRAFPLPSQCFEDRVTGQVFVYRVGSRFGFVFKLTFVVILFYDAKSFPSESNVPSIVPRCSKDRVTG